MIRLPPPSTPIPLLFELDWLFSMRLARPVTWIPAPLPLPSQVLSTTRQDLYTSMPSPRLLREVQPRIVVPPKPFPMLMPSPVLLPASQSFGGPRFVVVLH